MIQTSEKPHEYMWCISGKLTSSGKRMYYLGGTTAGDPYYTHSAQSSEEFRNLVPHGRRPIAERKTFIENPPPGISRRILIEFDVITEENEKEIKNKVWITENKFLLNRKERCWNRYYNNGLGDPRYVDQSGENNPSYKHGKACKEVHPISGKIHSPRSYHNEHRANNIERYRELERIRKRRQYDKMSSGGKKLYKLKKKESDAKRYAKKKTETQGEGTLKAFL
jgi:hypothetical protein